jgi:uncharacterized membrane protein
VTVTGVESETPLPGWVEISRTVFRVVTGIWGACLLIGFVIAAIRKLTGGGDLFPADDGGTVSEVIFLLVFLIPAAVSGLLWLIGEGVRGSREPL